MSSICVLITFNTLDLKSTKACENFILPSVIYRSCLWAGVCIFLYFGHFELHGPSLLSFFFSFSSLFVFSASLFSTYFRSPPIYFLPNKWQLSLLSLVGSWLKLSPPNKNSHISITPCNINLFYYLVPLYPPQRSILIDLSLNLPTCDIAPSDSSQCWK